MVYHIRRVHDQEERSIHKDDMEGLEMALREACFRTMVTQQEHEVVDDTGKRIHVVEVIEVVPVEQDNKPSLFPPPVAKPYRWDMDAFLISATLMAMAIFTLIR